VPEVVQTFVLLGGPGLLLGAAVGMLVPRWKVLTALVAVSGAAFLIGINKIPGCGDEDDCPRVVLALAVLTNFGGWALGLALGASVVRARERS
jgi:hypothetical protein